MSNLLAVAISIDFGNDRAGFWRYASEYRDELGTKLRAAIMAKIDNLRNARVKREHHVAYLESLSRRTNFNIWTMYSANQTMTRLFMGAEFTDRFTEHITVDPWRKYACYAVLLDFGLVFTREVYRELETSPVGHLIESALIKEVSVASTEYNDRIEYLHHLIKNERYLYATM